METNNISQRTAFVAFCKTFKEISLQTYPTHVALVCEDKDGNRIYINPPKKDDPNLTNRVINSDGKVLVDFTKDAAQIQQDIEQNKDALIVLKGDKNYKEVGTEDYTEETVYTLVAERQVPKVVLKIF